MQHLRHFLLITFAKFMYRIKVFVHRYNNGPKNVKIAQKTLHFRPQTLQTRCFKSFFITQVRQSTKASRQNDNLKTHFRQHGAKAVASGCHVTNRAANHTADITLAGLNALHTLHGHPVREHTHTHTPVDVSHMSKPGRRTVNNHTCPNTFA